MVKNCISYNALARLVSVRQMVLTLLLSYICLLPFYIHYVACTDPLTLWVTFTFYIAIKHLLTLWACFHRCNTVILFFGDGLERENSRTDSLCFSNLNSHWIWINYHFYMPVESFAVKMFHKIASSFADAYFTELSYLVPKIW